MKITRRNLITGAALVAATGGIGRKRSALASVALNPNTKRESDHVLVVLFLRGGADGLNIVPPHAEDAYYRLRPSLALARPGDKSVLAGARALDLNGFHGLHPALAPLLPLYQAGELAVVHAVGSGDQSRSHFEAMATMERGLAQDGGTASGWLARYLISTAGETESPLRAVAVSDTLPDSLRGAVNASAFSRLSSFRLIVPSGSDGNKYHPSDETSVSAALRAMYSSDKSNSDLVLRAGEETLAALDAVKNLDPANYRAENGAFYQDTELGGGFRQTACMIKGGVGLEIACLEMGGWDTHVAQGRDSGWQPARLAELGHAIRAFTDDLGSLKSKVTTVVMTEFGRRAYENSGLGTDHGRASCMFVWGGGVAGGKVYSEWPGLSEHQLDGPGDLRVTTDYRDILCEIVQKQMRAHNIADIFPNFTPSPKQIIRS